MQNLTFKTGYSYTNKSALKV